MKCTNKKLTQQQIARKRAARRKAARKKRIIRQMLIIFMSIVFIFILFLLLFTLNTIKSKAVDYVSDFEKKQYVTSIEDMQCMSSDLCVSEDDVALSGFSGLSGVHGEALFDVEDKKVVYSKNMFEEIYPASTTKILTTYVTLKYGNLDDTVTISSHAVDMPSDAQVCSLRAGDKIKLYDLLSGLMLYSGNDAAIAIAEHISGSVEEFVALMNEEAAKLGATHTHFVNPHGLHDDNHYTTVYDLYLIFNECLKYNEFNEIYSHKSYTATVTDINGVSRDITWIPTNHFSSGEATINSNFENRGGKTGTTNKAGACLVLSSKYVNGKQCISIVMGAPDKTTLYDEMNNILEASKIEL